jgi:hypothetical protein
MGATDQSSRQLHGEIEERQTFVDGIFQAAEGKDLSDEQLAIVNDQKTQMEKVNAKIEPLIEMRRISGDSAARVAEIAKYMSNQPGPPPEVEYRSAGAYVLDYWRAGLGIEESRTRLQTFNRTAAHQTTTDNPGLLPEQILGPVINFVDDSRPLVNAFGARQLPSGSRSRPKITQHTAVLAQSAEKAEMTSQKTCDHEPGVTPSPTVGTSTLEAGHRLDAAQIRTS